MGIGLVFSIVNLTSYASQSQNNQNLWPVIAQHFTIPADPRQADVCEQLDWDLRHPKYIYYLTENASPYIYNIFQETQKLHLPAELALLPMVLSQYNPNYTSKIGKAGLWQLTSNVESKHGVKMNFWYDGRLDTSVSTKVALMYLSYLYQQFNHNWLLALAAYNAGIDNVLNAMRYNEEHGRPTDFWALPLPRHTKAFIPKLLALTALIQHPKTYGIKLSAILNTRITRTLLIHKQTSIGAIAQTTHIDIKKIKELNPAFRQSVTPPHQAVIILLPINEKNIHPIIQIPKKYDQHVVLKKPGAANTYLNYVLALCGASYRLEGNSLIVLIHQSDVLNTLDKQINMGMYNQNVSKNTLMTNPIAYLIVSGVNSTFAIIPQVYQDHPNLNYLSVRVQGKYENILGNETTSLLFSFNMTKKLNDEINWSRFLPKNASTVFPNFHYSSTSNASFAQYNKEKAQKTEQMKEQLADAKFQNQVAEQEVLAKKLELEKKIEGIL